MKFLKKFLVELEKSPAVFVPGDRIRGKLVFESDEHVKVNALTIELNGEAYVHW